MSESVNRYRYAMSADAQKAGIESVPQQAV
jgi:hypothetical protein